MALHKEKYRQIILYICQKLGGEVRGKKKLAKLLYFVDFDFFEKYQKSMTGEVYKALPMGPFPSNLDIVTGDMVKKKYLDIEKRTGPDGYNPTETYHAKTRSDVSVFSKQEQQMLDRVITKYGHLNGKQLEDLSHHEAPYAGTKPQGEIYYELSYYRDTDFSDL